MVAEGPAPTVTVQEIAVPRLGHGTFRLNGAVGRAAVRRALELGYRHLDTARSYENEHEVGAAIAESGVGREQLFLTAKLWLGDLPPVCVRPAVESSLRSLRTDYLDLLLIHWPPPERLELAAICDAVRVLREEGKVRHLGVSNFPPGLLTRALALAPIFCNQVEHHPYLGQPEQLRLARAHGILLTAYAPLGSGFVLRDRVLAEIAHARGVEPAQIALRWLLHQDQVAVIPRSADARHQAANLRALEFSLTEDERRRIDALERGMRLYDPPYAPLWSR
jgi:2,5-diketo-D-gluconate reductase B